MTAIVGVLCKDGVVIGSDSASTFSAGGNFRTIEQPTQKCHIVNSEVLLCGTGSVGLNQRFYEIIFSQWPLLKQSNLSPVNLCSSLTTLGIQNFVSTNININGGIQYAALTAFIREDNFHLCEFELGTFQPEMKTNDMWYVSMGSGQPITDPFLGFVRKVFWEDKQPDLKDGIYGAIWALEQVIALNTGGVNGPIQLMTLTKDSLGNPQTKLFNQEELQEHKEYVSNLENEIKNIKQKFNETKLIEIPKMVDDSDSAEKEA